MTAAISYFIAAISTFALLALWFINAYQAIYRKKKDLMQAEEQVILLRECFDKMRHGPNEASAGKMLETSSQIYTQIEKSYNETLLKPINRVPGFLMGFRKVEGDWEIREEDQMTYICEDCGFVFYGVGEIGECPYCGKRRIRSAIGEENKQLWFITQQQKTDYHSIPTEKLPGS